MKSENKNIGFAEPKGTMETRNSIQTKRDYNREKQRLYRSKMTPQKKNWVKKKEREREREREREKKRANKQSRSLREKAELKITTTCNSIHANSEKPSNQCQEQFIKELRKIPKGKSALIRAARGLVKK